MLPDFRGVRMFKIFTLFVINETLIITTMMSTKNTRTFTYDIISFHVNDNPLWHILLSPFYKWGNLGPEMLSTLLRITQWGSGRARIQNQVHLMSKPIVSSTCLPGYSATWSRWESTVCSVNSYCSGWSLWFPPETPNIFHPNSMVSPLAALSPVPTKPSMRIKPGWQWHCLLPLNGSSSRPFTQWLICLRPDGPRHVAAFQCAHSVSNFHKGKTFFQADGSKATAYQENMEQ